jgi:hypothetical protein
VGKWYKSITKAIGKVTKPIAKALDPLLPEAAKSGLDKMDAMTGNLLYGNAYGKPLDQGGGTAAPEDMTGRIAEEEAQKIASSRLARLGKYFTSPLGVLNGAKTGSSKVFS